jgi:uncharacterized membrane protein YsdA (DUF1294 family)
LYWGWLVIINLVAFILFRIDKGQAQRGGQRIPEVTLLVLMLAGGVLGGAAGMLMRPRHKSRKPTFWVILLLAVALHAYVIYQLLGL